MRILWILALVVSTSAVAATGSAQAPTAAVHASSNPDATAKDTTSPKIKYKSGKDVNFEELLIQGEIKRPELSVVTGNTQPGADGLLRLRENFLDRITTDVGEELP